MNLIAAFDLISFLIAIIALVPLLTGWRRSQKPEIKALLFGIIGLIILHNLGNFCENSEICASLEPISDYLDILTPALWIFLLYSLLKENSDKALQISEEMYRSLFENTGTAIALIREDMIIAKANVEFLKLCGYSKEELEGKIIWTEFVVPDDLEWMKEYHRRRREEGAYIPTEYEFRFIDRYGSIKDAFLKIYMVPGTTDSIASLVDITERNLATDRIEHLNLVLKSIRSVNLLTTEEASRDELINRICASLTENRGYENVWISLFDDPGEFVCAAESGLGAVFDSLLDLFKKGELPQCCRISLERPGLQIGKMDSVGCESCPLQALHGNSVIFTTQLRHKNKRYGIIGASIPTQLSSDDEESSLFMELANDLASALYHIEIGEEQKRAEEQLRLSEERYRAIVEETPVLLCRFLPGGEITSVNEAYCRYFAKTAEELIGVNFLTLIPESERECVINEINSLTVEAPTSSQEHRVIAPSGEIRWHRWINRGLFDSSGRPVAYQSIGEDITEQRRAEEALRASEELYHSIFENTGNATCIIDENMTFKRVNAEMARFIGKSKEEIEGKHKWTDFIPVEDLPRLTEMHRSRRQEGANPPNQYEIRFINADGEIRNGFLRADLIPGTNESVASLMDITDLKRADEALKTSERLYQSIFENTGTATFIVDEDMTFSVVNAEMERFLGKPKEEIEGKMPFTVMLPDNELERIKGFHRLRRQPGGNPPKNYELQCIDAEGNIRNALLRVDMIPGTMKSIASLIDITELKQAEEARRKSEEMLNIALSAADLTTWNYNVQTGEIEAGGKMPASLGYTSNELDCNISAREAIIHPDDLPVRSEKLNAHIAGDTPYYEAEFRVRSKMGEYRWVISRGKVIARDEEGRPLRMAGTNLDITDRKQAEEALRESEKSYRLLAENVSDIIWLGALNKRKALFVSPSVERLLGYSVEEVMKLPREKIIAPESLARFKREITPDVLEEAARSDPHWSFTIDLEMIRKDGSTVWTEATYSLLRDDAGKPAGLVAVSRDITERKRAESALRESEERYRLLAENISDMIWIRDVKTLKSLYISPSITRLTGFTPEEAISRSWQEGLTPDSFKIAMELLKEEMELERTGQGDPDRSGTLELELRCKDGSTVWTEVSMTFLRDENGKASAILGVTRDITQRRQAEQKLLQAQKMEAIGHLAGGIAHDFNNLLTAIMGNIELLKMDYARDSSLPEELDEAYTSARKAADLTQQLLAFSRKQNVSPVALDLNKVIKGTSKMLRRLIREDIEISMSLRHSLPSIKADPTQVEQVVLNLALNSRDAMPHGGKLTIETDAVLLDEMYLQTHPDAAVGPHSVLTIIDTGEGMDQDIISHIFEPFYTTKRLGRGTGLGLSTVYGIVRQSGGHINVYSEKRMGTSMKIYFPVVAEEAADVKKVEKKAVSILGKGETILVVEDDIAVKELLKRILSGVGYEFRIAEDCEEAISIAYDLGDNLDLLLTDVIMPGMPGKDLAEIIGSACQQFRTLFMSGYTQDVIAQSGVMGDGVEFIGKPFSPQDLLSKIREVLDK
ncbi:MAG: PAS domain S-box protein [Candidatus Coatesbacteria bacterium]|nr:PAS domain S-box protein [Candidatus Coatesbacteria bacterium]